MVQPETSRVLFIFLFLRVDVWYGSNCVLDIAQWNIYRLKLTGKNLK